MTRELSIEQMKREIRDDLLPEIAHQVSKERWSLAWHLAKELAEDLEEIKRRKDAQIKVVSK